MKLSKIDLRILMAIRKENEPMANYQIAAKLKKSPGQIVKRLKLLEKNRILVAANSWPKFYTLNSNNTAQDFIIQTVECPSCKELHILHHEQCTVQCSCLTASGKRRRFFIYDKRIKNKRILKKQSEEEIIENDVKEIMS